MYGTKKVKGGEGRRAGADQSHAEPWEGRTGKSGASKETNASSAQDQGKEGALQGVSNLEKMAPQPTTGP